MSLAASGDRIRHLVCGAVALVLSWGAPAVSRGEATALLPQATQGYVRIIDMPRLSARWEETELSKLAKDPGLKPFWEDQKKDIEVRLADAGWQLNIEAKQLVEIASSEVVMGWIEKPTERRKPFSLALIVDITGKKAEVDKLFADIDRQLKQKGATSKSLTEGSVKVLQYTLPRKPGELLFRETFYCRTEEQLLASDDLATLQSMIRAMGNPVDSLSKDATYLKAMERLGSYLDRGEIEYFIRPLGFARVLRDVAGKRNANRTDVLEVLQAQGFSSFEAICGRLEMGTEKYDMFHQGFVLSAKPLQGSAAVVDTPNEVTWEVPGWVGPNVASFVAICWDLKDAFWKSEPLVDGLADQPGVFKELIKGLAESQTGPKVNIVDEVIPYLTNEVISVSDCKEPITVDSRRTLIAMKILDPAKLQGVLERVMNNEPDATIQDFEGHKYWKVTRQDDENVLGPDLDEDFGDFGDKPAPSKESNDANQPWLSNWAITIYGDYLMFASHDEMIRDAIAQAKSKTASPLESDDEYKRVREVLDGMSKDRPSCTWQVLRSDLSYRVQYELFREGKLPQSETIFSSVLERLTKPRKELKGKEEQKIDGSKLPPFDEIRRYLQPAGLMVEDVADGWIYTGFLLSAPAK